MKYLPGVGVLRIFERNMRASGKTDAEILAAMQKRLNLERFDPATMGEEDRKKYEELREFLRVLERPTLQ